MSCLRLSTKGLMMSYRVSRHCIASSLSCGLAPSRVPAYIDEIKSSLKASGVPRPYLSFIAHDIRPYTSVTSFVNGVPVSPIRNSVLIAFKAYRS